MEERKVELVVCSSSESSSDRTKLPARSDEKEMVVGCVDPRLRIQDSDRTEYVAPVRNLSPSPTSTRASTQHALLTNHPCCLCRAH